MVIRRARTVVSSCVRPDCTKSAAKMAPAAVRVGEALAAREDLHAEPPLVDFTPASH